MDATWLEITLETTGAELEGVADRLTANGVAGLVIEDEEDFHTFLEENRQYWDYVGDALMEQMKGAARIKFYVTDDASGAELLAQYLEGLEDQKRTAVKLRENDWATSWQKYYKPMASGERVYIVPQWEKEETPIPAGRTALYLNPGLIFGTGSHASTRLCLEGVEQYVQKDGRVLDLGCGSGILSIAALLLGAERAVGVDIDPKAVNVAYENAAMNGIGKDRYHVLAGDVLGDKKMADALAQEKYDLVLANIVADVIIPLSAHANELMTDNGVFLCSGVIDTRADEVGAALTQNGLTILARTERDGWVSFAARRA